jgi:L-serine dehydratase
MATDDLDIPRSFDLAAERGLSFSFYNARLREAHPNTAVLKLTDAEGNTLEMQAASTGGGRIRVEQLNGVDVNFTGMFNTLIIRHQDVSGEVADITRELAGVKTSIANMSLCRSRRGGDALMVIETDQPIPPIARTLISELRGVKSMTYYEKEAD